MTDRPAAQFPDETSAGGDFVRQTSAFRQWVRADGSTQHAAEAGRYHLYVSLACPWAHRTVIVRRLKGLEQAIGMTVVNPVRDERGWAFRAGPGHGPDPLEGFRFLSEAYRLSDPAFEGRVTVPVLWDRQTRRIVNNESADLLRMLDAEFDAFTDVELDLYPADLRGEIDGLNERIYRDVNNGVYRAGFASSQAAYERAFTALFAALDWLDGLLATRRYLTGPRITEADWRLFTTLVRFDPVYLTHFKCNRNRLTELEHLWPYVRDLYQQPGVAQTVDLDHIKRHYFLTHGHLNPSGIVPLGPRVDFGAPHGRARLVPS